MENAQQDTPVTYHRAHLLPKEKVLDSVKYAFVVIFGAAAIMLGLFLMMGWGYFLQGTVAQESDRNTIGNVALLLVAVELVSVTVAFVLEWLSSHFYKEVSQGKVISVTTTTMLDGAAPIYKKVKLEGYNRMNQERTQVHKIKGDRRSREYKPGQYVNFS